MLPQLAVQQDLNAQGSIEVVQCRNCDVIVGDSSEYVHHDVEEATLTLRTAINVKVDSKKRFEYVFFFFDLFFIVRRDRVNFFLSHFLFLFSDPPFLAKKRGFHHNLSTATNAKHSLARF